MLCSRIGLVIYVRLLRKLYVTGVSLKYTGLFVFT